MANKKLSRFFKENCSDITVWHLIKKRDRLNRRVQRINANEADYVAKERVEAQLEDAKKHHC